MSPILLFDPRREHPSASTTDLMRRRAQTPSRLAVGRRGSCCSAARPHADGGEHDGSLGWRGWCRFQKAWGAPQPCRLRSRSSPRQALVAGRSPACSCARVSARCVTIASPSRRYQDRSRPSDAGHDARIYLYPVEHGDARTTIHYARGILAPHGWDYSLPRSMTRSSRLPKSHIHPAIGSTSSAGILLCLRLTDRTVRQLVGLQIAPEHDHQFACQRDDRYPPHATLRIPSASREPL